MNDMKKRRIGRSDLYVSEISLGCMSFGTDSKNAAAILDVALANGINYLDTADLYDQGLNEETIGSIIKSKRKDLIIATKVGNRFEKGKEGWSWDPSKTYIKNAVKESLRRLQTDYIDLYQLHGGTIADPIDETIEAFEELKQEGVIRYYGISSIRPNVITEYVKRSNIISVMMQYSLLDRRPEELFPLLEDQDISVLVRGSLARGILTDKPLTSFSSTIKEKGYLSYSFDDLASLRATIQKEMGDTSMHTAALHYCLASPVVASVVVGASSRQQVEETISAYTTQPLVESELASLKRMTKPSRYEEHRI